MSLLDTNVVRRLEAKKDDVDWALITEVFILSILAAVAGQIMNRLLPSENEKPGPRYKQMVPETSFDIE